MSSVYYLLILPPNAEDIGAVLAAAKNIQTTKDTEATKLKNDS